MAAERDARTPLPSATTEALLCADERERRERLEPSIVDVSHGEGVPIGTLGSGHSVFGRHGFSRVAFAGAPDIGPDFASPRLPADFALFLSEGERTYALQQALPDWRNAALRAELVPMQRVFAYAGLPKAHYRFEEPSLELELVMTAFSPLIPHDVATSSLPVQVFELTLENRSGRARNVELRLAHRRRLETEGDVACRRMPNGQLAFAAQGGSADEHGAFFGLSLEPGERETLRFFVAWYFPEFRTPSPAATATYRRHYAARFKSATEVVRYAQENAGEWSRVIDGWRASYDVPPEMKRLWFSSLSSVITCTMLSDDPFFFAIEAPHDWVNTMDVAVYANWVYLVNWPELERMDLEQYLRVIPLRGEQAGFVWHSLWVDATHYAEEPTFLTRLWRAHLWLNDMPWLREAFPTAQAAANHAHRRDSVEHLLNSAKGNQSYDEWMMPGVSAYVNVAWLYALHALAAMGKTLGTRPEVAGRAVGDLLGVVRTNLERRLWSEREHGYFRCFHRTPGASDASVEESVFSDQLFGAWVSLIDPSSAGVLPRERIRAVLATIYDNNLLEDEASGFRGWTNGMLPGRQPDVESGYHARTCWLGAQLDLASLLGAAGDEARSLDVFRSVEASLFGNHLAVGEWNRAVDAEGRAVVLDESNKDTPRFPPYPRYTACWEYLIRMLGLTLDAEYIHLAPFTSLGFELKNVKLAGSPLSVRVEPNWTRALVDGVEGGPRVRIRRDGRAHDVEFLAERRGP